MTTYEQGVSDAYGYVLAFLESEQSVLEARLRTHEEASDHLGQKISDAKARRQTQENIDTLTNAANELRYEQAYLRGTNSMIDQLVQFIKMLPKPT